MFSDLCAGELAKADSPVIFILHRAILVILIMRYARRVKSGFIAQYSCFSHEIRAQGDIRLAQFALKLIQIFSAVNICI
ncbi:MAG TPA: hypothetical protein DCG37_07015 [Lachnospiraceae bacterium]|nr:hypothetical protein [Lachnospiraceae bacterium]